jgi:hypothetical protein
MISVMDTLVSNNNDRNNSPIRRVGSTITTTSMSANNIGLSLQEISSPSITNVGIQSQPGSRFEQVRHSF